ncbi:potassium channel family protein [Natronococcus occultus]|uniref:K+ transport system, NAD-binding component n=1 Tax=Natronococcus occultus SP4 TaxID=694430 RepID=L0JX87_9EURY|nr:NAD-binding protein [Natronococcus occultus]AGB36900.1 K+ transport system, NAD-binding component [Natronococcus occultus SP4]
MVKLTRRLAVYVGSLLFLIALYTLTYRWGMAVYEGESRTWYQSLELVVQSMTTTGYGQDAPWTTLEMTALVLLVQVTGIAYIAVAIPQFVVPWLETLVQPSPPEEIDRIEDHVVVVGYTALCDTLVDELEADGTPYVILEGDEDRAQRLHEDGLAVLYGEPDDDRVLEAVRLEEATAVVVDATEREFVATVLAIESRDPRAALFVLVTDPSRARYFRYAGVDEVLSPKHRLGKALGDRIRTVIAPAPEGEITLGDGLDLTEFYVDADAELFDETMAETQSLEETGATVVGAWVRGDFVTELSEQVHVDENTSLLIAGTESALEAVADRTGSPGSPYRTTEEPVVVVGAGLVGRTAAGTLERAGLETTVVDREDDEIVDVVGDATEEETLLAAGIEDAGTVVIAVERDDDAVLVTLTADALHPDAEIIVGADTTDSLRALRAAGADHVLALPNVAGRMIALRAFEREVMPLGDQLRLRQLAAPGLVDSKLETATVREQTDCIVVGLERNGEYHSDVDGTRLERGDSIVIAGTDGQIDRFQETYADEES